MFHDTNGTGRSCKQKIKYERCRHVMEKEERAGWVGGEGGSSASECLRGMLSSGVLFQLVSNSPK